MSEPEKVAPTRATPWFRELYDNIFLYRRNSLFYDVLNPWIRNGELSGLQWHFHHERDSGVDRQAGSDVEAGCDDRQAAGRAEWDYRELCQDRTLAFCFPGGLARWTTLSPPLSNFEIVPAISGGRCCGA